MPSAAHPPGHESTSDRWSLAASGAAGAALGVALAGPFGVLAGAAAGQAMAPFIDEVVHAVLLVREERGGEFMSDVADRCSKSPADLVADLTDDRAAMLFFAEALAAASLSIDPAKLRALAAVAAEGLEDDAVMDERRLVVLALADIERPHIRLLALVSEPRGHSDDHRTSGLAAALPGIGPGIHSLLATLNRHGQIEPEDMFDEQLRTADERRRTIGHRTGTPPESAPYPVTWPRPQDVTWQVTPFGTRVLELLRSVVATGVDGETLTTT